ncbi:MAG: beta-lactamase family protein [Proteobacteria bacterium]|nr:beta-lactamase family protein [Pseudomonadota bacterium]
MRFSSTRRRLLAGVATTLLLPAAARAQPAPKPPGKETVAAALPKLRQFARDIVDRKLVPGLSIAVVQGDEVVFLEAFGVRQVDRPEPVGVDTVFQLASVSKPLAATTVAALVGDGKVTWDSRIRDIDPGFALHDALASAEVTVRDLFAHRSGLASHVGDDIEELGFSQGEILQRLRLAKPAYGFRNGYAYSNFGLTEAAVAAARAAGKGWAETAEERLYRPLGMAATSSRNRDFMAQADRAALHVRRDGQWASFTRRNADAQSPAGGASSTARDMAQWLRLLLNDGRHDGKQVIDKAALDQTHVPAVVRGTDPQTGVTGFYGLGWNVDYREHGVEWSHAGAFAAGARTTVRLVPRARLGIVVLANAFPTGVPEGIAQTFLDYVFAGSPTRDWVAFANQVFDTAYREMMKPSEAYATPPAAPAPPLPNAAYAGAYRNDYVGDARVEDSGGGGGLFLILGPSGNRRFPLTPFNRDLFVYSPFAETPQARIGVTFLIGPDGKASAVTIEDLNEYGLGTLARVGTR